MPRFAVLIHDHPYLHWDFLLEQDECLRAWRLMQQPAPGISVAAEALPDHRKHYLDYEGPVSNNRGEVRQWDRGEFVCIEEAHDHVRVHLDGLRLCGSAALDRDSGTADWTFLFSANRES